MKRAAAVSNWTTTDADAARLAGQVLAAFTAFHDAFRAVTRRARDRFERRDWHGAEADAAERLALYRTGVERTVASLRSALPFPGSTALWAGAKTACARAIAGRNDAEIAATFFNSVVRRVEGTTGIDPLMEFEGVEIPAPPSDPALVATLPCSAVTPDAIDRVLDLFRWSVPYAARTANARRAAAIVQSEIALQWGTDALGSVEGIDVVRAIFYRSKGAYIVGRVRRGRAHLPLVLALVHGPNGILIDAVLPTADEASVVFGFSWSYFRVDVDRPGALVAFLASLMPLKRVDELYTAIGYNRHGKTELYRSLREHLARADARFERAEGDEGMVMSVFTLPSFNVVFKIIKDAFSVTKRVTRRGVMDRYHFVFVRDRVGRLADAQEFESLELPAPQFDPALLAELARVCARTVLVDGDRVLVRHAYTERRVTPLNLYLRRADPAAARDAIVDFGQAIKDLAGSNIFAGDMLPKNFGVTRHGRVICYDYDELALLTDCVFRALPGAAHPDDELASEPPFYVGDADVFPEEFPAFLPLPAGVREAFLAAHSDLFTVDYWRTTQARVDAGEMLDVFPYRPRRRLAPSV